MLELIESIAAYTKLHSELRAAHHFLFDLKYPPNGEPKFVVMGINPGERAADWQFAPEPTEETSRYDFHVALGVGREVIPWARMANHLLDGSAFVQTELFFWSSRNMDEFVSRFGRLAQSPHLPFCVQLNRRLIEAYMPRAVIFPGLGQANLCQRLFDLQHRSTEMLEGTRLVEVYSDGVRPWLFTKHWTGSYGFSREQQETVRAAIRSFA